MHDFIEMLLLHSDSAGIHISDLKGYSEVWFGKQQQQQLQNRINVMISAVYLWYQCIDTDMEPTITGIAKEIKVNWCSLKRKQKKKLIRLLLANATGMHCYDSSFQSVVDCIHECEVSETP